MARHNGKYSFFLLVFILFAIYCFIFGDSGILERRRISGNKANLENRISELKEENSRLKDLRDKYGKGEYMDEEAAAAGYIREGEKVLFFKAADEKKKQVTVKKEAGDGAYISAAHLRILWVVFSMMFILIYFILRNKYRKSNQ